MKGTVTHRERTADIIHGKTTSEGRSGQEKGGKEGGKTNFKR